MLYEASNSAGGGELKTIFCIFEKSFSYNFPSEPARRETLKTGLKIVIRWVEGGDN
jgi:hypothetical protein